MKQNDNPQKSNDSKDDRLEQHKNDRESIESYFQSHFREIVAYAILVLGIFLLFFDSIYGQVLVGVVAGIYFGNDIVTYVLNWKTSLSACIARNLISAGVILAFFISAPAIFLGAALTIALKQLFNESK